MYRIELITSFSPYSTTPIYTEQTQDNLPVSNAHFTTEINEGGNLEFTLVSGHPYYSLLEPLVSYISLMDDGGEVLYGRVYDRSDPTLTGQITYQVEGALSFLQDSEVEPESKDADGNYNVRTLTAEQFFRWCIAQHNADTADPRRRFAVGVITASRKNETNEYQITSYTETKSAIQQYILDQYGGMLRVRKGEGAIHYIDWIQDYGVVNSQPIELGTNVEDQTNAMTADGVFTVLRPVGANGLTLQQKTVNVYPQEQINRMGRIVKSIVFQDADTEEKLLAKANSYIARIEKKLDKETSVKLVDFHFLNSAVKKIRMGDMFTNIYGFEDDTLTVYSVDQDILHIEDGQYTLKNKKELGTITDGRVKGGTISKSSARGARAGGLALKYYHEATDEATLEVKKLHIIAEDMDMHLNTLDLDVKETADIAAKSWNLATENYESISHVENTLDQYRETTDSQIYGLNIRVRDVEGSGVIQNSDHITTVSGKFEIWEDPQTGKETVHLRDGAEMAVDGLNGSIITVGGLNDKARDAENAIARHTIEIDGVQGVVSEMTGSALWTQRDHITGVSGEFDVIELPDPEHPGHYIKHLKIVSGGGMTIERDNVEYGLYDNGNLTGGLIVQKINDSDTHTNISGDHIVVGQRVDGGVSKDIKLIATDNMEIGLVNINSNGEAVLEAGTKIYRKNGNVYSEYGIYDEKTLTGGLMVTKINGQSASQIKGDLIKIGELDNEDLDTWAAEAKAGTGVFAKFLTVKHLTAEEITTLLADIGNATITNLAVTNNISAGGHMQAGRLVVNSGGSVRFIGTETGEYYDLNRSDITGMIVKASVDNVTNTLKLWKKGDPDSAPSITFSKATSLSGAWSGNTYTVSASPQGNTISTSVASRFGVDQGHYYIESYRSADAGAPGISGSGITYQMATNAVTIELQDMNGSKLSNTPSLTLEDKTGTNRITSNGTYAPSGSNVGFSAVQIDVQTGTSLSGAWNRGILTVTASPQQETYSAQLTAAATTWDGNIGSRVIWDGTAADAQHGRQTGYTVNVDATARYDAGVAAGKNAVTISKGSWSSGKVTFSKSEGTASNSGVLVSLSGSWSGNSYNYTIYDSWGGTAASTGYTGTIDATARYNAGVTAGKNAVTISKGSWSSGKVTFSKSEGTASNSGVQVSLGGSWSGNSYNYTIYDSWSGSAASTGYTGSIDASGRYNAGYSSGVTAGKNAVTISKGSWSSGKVTFSKSEGTASNSGVLVSLSGSWSGNNYNYTIYDSWSGSAASTGYTGSIDASGRYNAGYSSGVTAGKNAVTISKGSWSSGKISFTKSEGTASTKTVQLTAAATTWSGNTGSRVIWDGTAADAQHGVSTGYTVTVDASGRYNAGYSDGNTAGYNSGYNSGYSAGNTAGYNSGYSAGESAGYSSGVTAGKNAVTISKGSWSGGQVTFSKSEGTASNSGVTVSLSGSWSGNSYNYTIYDSWSGSAVSTGYTGSVDASGRYSAGVSYGSNNSWFAYTTDSWYKNATHGSDPNYNNQGKLDWGGGKRIGFLGINADGTYYVRGTWEVPGYPYSLEYSGGTDPGASYNYLGTITSGNADAWYAVKDGASNTIARFVLGKAGGGGGSHSVSLTVDLGWTESVSGYTNMGSKSASSLARTYLRVSASCGNSSVKRYWTIN